MNQMSPITAGDAGISRLSFGEILALIERDGVALGRPGVIRLYQTWIRGQDPNSPATAPAWFNLGVVFAQEGERGHAMACYEAALTARPDLHAAAVNLGLMLEAAGRAEEALALWHNCLQPVSARTALLNNAGRLAETLGRLAAAERDLRASLLLDPAQPDVVQHFVHIRQKRAAWPALDEELPGLPPAALLRQSGPLAAMALTDDVATQVEVGAAWVARKTVPGGARLSPAEGYGHQRIRIGYLSSDFCRHAMSYLIAELFERHDRRRFEVFGYDSAPEDGSPIRARILAAFDQVRRVRDVPDALAARMIREDEIDVLIDLNGLTAGSRLQVLRHRPAPVQATYLGFVGPVPLPELDYLLCDDIVIPPERAGQYRPAPLAVGKLYQANDSAREVGAPVTRAEVGLPEGRFLLCCFSNYYKITPEMFGAWLEILRQAPGAVLWLADDGSGAREALVARAGAAGVAAERLIFTGRVGPAEYLARLRLADLFLDTFPYNAGTVASDAIRMNVPLVTRAGRAFASRMAARLLLAVGAGEGITESAADYVAAAVRFATDADSYRAYKAKFTDAAWQDGPGDVAGFTAGFEAAIAGVAIGINPAGPVPPGTA